MLEYPRNYALCLYHLVFTQQGFMTRIVIWILLLLWPDSVFAAAWVLPKGSALLIANTEWYYNNRFWNINGDLISGPAFNQLSLNPYFEYGLTDNLTIGENTFFRQVWRQDVNTGMELGDSEFFGRYRFWHNSYSVFSGQFGFNLPWVHPLFFISPLPPTVSNGQYWIEGRLLYGIGGALPKLANSSWFLDFEAGYQPNYNGAADQVNTEVVCGWKSPAEKWTVTLKEYNIFTMHNQTVLNAPNYNLATIEPGILYSITKEISLEVGVYQDFWGTNVGKGTQPFVALWWHSNNILNRIPAQDAE